MFIDINKEAETIWDIIFAYEQSLIDKFKGQHKIPKKLQDDIDDAKFSLHLFEENLKRLPEA
tara:strand:+ start:2767 stop:2952 length:186 start_codon:yes stop_codon:yes gene_type:complete